MCATRCASAPATPRCRRCGALGCWRWPTPWICSARAWTARCSTGPARRGPRRTSPSWTGHLRARGLQRPTLDCLHLAHQHRQQHRRARPVPGPPDHQRDGRRPHHHEEPAARAPWSRSAKMWRKLGAWFWLATQNLDDLPKAAEPMLNMISGGSACRCRPMKSEDRASQTQCASQKALMLSAWEAGKFSGASSCPKVDGSAVPRRAASLYLAMAMTEPEEGRTLPVDAAARHPRTGCRLPRGREDRPCAGHRTPGAGHAGLTGATRCACPHSPAVIPGSVC